MVSSGLNLVGDDVDADAAGAFAECQQMAQLPVLHDVVVQQ